MAKLGLRAPAGARGLRCRWPATTGPTGSRVDRTPALADVLCSTQEPDLTQDGFRAKWQIASLASSVQQQILVANRELVKKS